MVNWFVEKVRKMVVLYLSPYAYASSILPLSPAFGGMERGTEGVRFQLLYLWVNHAVHPRGQKFPKNPLQQETNILHLAGIRSRKWRR